MTSEIVKPQESNPVINNVPIASRARGAESIAKVLGGIADRSISKATEYASEASKANLLQTHGMLSDVEMQSKIDMAKSPEHAEGIAKNAQNTIDKIRQDSRLNREDKRNLDSMAQNTVRGLTLDAAHKSISLARETAKYNALSAFSDTLQSIRQTIFTNPEQADALIEAQNSALLGQVRSGIITAVEAQNIHKQLMTHLEVSHELVSAMKEGILNAADLNSMHATNPNQAPLSNANLPINNDTAMMSNHYYGHLTTRDIESKMASGHAVSPMDLINIKKQSDLEKILNYGAGAAQATGKINSGTPWNELNHRLDVLKKTEKLSLREEGEKNRLNNFINNAKQPGSYQNFIIGMPEGARAYLDYSQKQAAINKDVVFGSEDQVSLKKHNMSLDNLNELISKSAAIGVGMNYPDNLRQPIPLQYITPIVNGFNKDGNVADSLNNLRMLNKENRMYAMNAFHDNPRQAMTVYETGNLLKKETLILFLI